MSALSGKVSIVTGSATDIGKAIAQRFAAAGARVVIDYVGKDCVASASATEEAITRAGGEYLGVSADVSDPAQAQDLVARAVAKFGKLDIVVNNAGISPIYKPSIEVTQDEWDAIFAVNVSAPFRVSQAAARAMIAAGNGGAIIQMASVAGMIATPRMIAYGAAKAALLQISRTLAVEWANKGIRVNAIAPGYIATDLTAGIMSVPRYFDGIRAATPLGRFGEPDEIAGIAVYLASAASSFATGQTFIVDGGISAQ